MSKLPAISSAHAFVWVLWKIKQEHGPEMESRWEIPENGASDGRFARQLDGYQWKGTFLSEAWRAVKRATRRGELGCLG